MDFACSSDCLNAATVLMSGLGAPARTSIPTSELTRSVRVSAVSLPALIILSSTGGGAARISNCSPELIRLMSSGLNPVTTVSLLPVSRSNCDPVTSSTVAIALAVSTFNSADTADVPAPSPKNADRRRIEQPCRIAMSRPWVQKARKLDYTWAEPIMSMRYEASEHDRTDAGTDRRFWHLAEVRA